MAPDRTHKEGGVAFRPGEQHPEPWRDDLNPQRMAGQNVGGHEPGARTAYDVKEAHRLLEGITDDGLKQIPVLSPGTRLEQGATYIDLRDPQRREFTATGDMTASSDNWYVPKSGVDYELWNRLIGIQNPERLYQAPET
ncbi:MAG TPA: hypothetical protein VGL99_14430 [Chloroflexota bacterium]|jgi:hypothetical protein